MLSGPPELRARLFYPSVAAGCQEEETSSFLKTLEWKGDDIRHQLGSGIKLRLQNNLQRLVLRVRLETSGNLQRSTWVGYVSTEDPEEYEAEFFI